MIRTLKLLTPVALMLSSVDVDGTITTHTSTTSSTSSTSHTFGTTSSEEEPYIFSDGGCDQDNYCDIVSKERCENAALYLSVDDTKARLKDESTTAAGCTVNSRGSLRWNRDLSSTISRSDRSTARTLCELCHDEEYIASEGRCDDYVYCTIDKRRDCRRAAEYLNYADTRASLVSSSTRVAGCFTDRHGELLFNDYLGSDTIHKNAGARSVLCKVC